MKQYVGELFQQHKKKRKVLAKTPSFTSAIELVCQTDAPVTAPPHIAGQFADKLPITIQPLPFELPLHSYYLLWHSKYQNDPAHRWFREQSFLLLQLHLKETYEAGHRHLHTMNGGEG